MTKLQNAFYPKKVRNQVKCAVLLAYGSLWPDNPISIKPAQLKHICKISGQSEKKNFRLLAINRSFGWVKPSISDVTSSAHTGYQLVFRQNLEKLITSENTLIQ